MTDRHRGPLTAFQERFGTFLLASFCLGVVLPAPGTPPTALVPLLLAVVLYLAVARIDAEDLASVDPRAVLGFYVLRFVLVPAALGCGAALVAPDHVLAVVVLTLLPTGVTTTAIVGILGGNAAIALAVTAVSTGLAPLTLPAAVWLVGGPELSPFDVGASLLLLLALPTGFHLLVTARSVRAVAALRRVGPPLSVVLICTIAFLVASSQQGRIRADPVGLSTLIVIGGALYAVLYAVGLAFARGLSGERRAWALVSGNNNIVLGLTLALLHFGPEEVLAFLAWDIAWILGLSAIQPIVRGNPGC